MYNPTQDPCLLKVKFYGVHYEGSVIKISPPLLMQPTWDSEVQFFRAKDESVGIDVYSESYEDLMARVEEVIIHNWETYAKAEDDQLSPRAIELKRRLLDRMAMESPPQPGQNWENYGEESNKLPPDPTDREGIQLY